METLILREDESFDEFLTKYQITNYQLFDSKNNQIEQLGSVGYYKIKSDNRSIDLIYYPQKAYGVDEKTFGFHIQLFSLIDINGFGVGDFACLRTLIDYTKKVGGKFIQLNPMFPIDHSWFHSPYEPITRFAVDPIYIDIDKLLEKYGLTRENIVNEDERNAINTTEIIDYEDCLRIKHKICYEVFKQNRQFTDNKFRKLSEKMADLHSEFLEDIENPIEFLTWLHTETELQFEELKQYAKEKLSLGLFSDLPMGMSVEYVDETTSINKNAYPTIQYSDQQWNIASFDFNKFEEESYWYFIESLRYSMKGFGAIRIDNDSSLKQFTYFDKKEKADKGVVSEHYEKLLAIICLESVLNECQVIFECHFNYSNEELTDLYAKNISFQNIYLSTTDENNMICEPSQFKANSFLMFSTHDIYPLKAHLTSTNNFMDISAQEDENWVGFVNLHKMYLERELQNEFGLKDLDVDGLVKYANLLGAKSNANMFSMQLNDLLGMTERVNIPNTSFGFKNWRLKLPKITVDIFTNPDIMTLLNDVKKLRRL